MGVCLKIPEVYEEMTCFQCIKKFVFIFFHALDTNESFRRSYDEAVLNSHRNIFNKNITVCQFKGLNDETNVCSLLKWIKDSNDCNIYGSSLNDLGDFTQFDIPSVFWLSNWRESLCRCKNCQVN